jgi:hypothetical protein
MLEEGPMDRLGGVEEKDEVSIPYSQFACYLPAFLLFVCCLQPM